MKRKAHLSQMQTVGHYCVYYHDDYPRYLLQVLLPPSPFSKAKFQAAEFICAQTLSGISGTRHWNGLIDNVTLFGSILLPGWHGWIQEGHIRDYWNHSFK